MFDDSNGSAPVRTVAVVVAVAVLAGALAAGVALGMPQADGEGDDMGDGEEPVTPDEVPGDAPEDAGDGDGEMTDGPDGADEAAADGEMAQVRLVHASPDAPAVDVYVDGEAVAENVSFGNVSGYLDVAPGERNITITVADDPEAVVFQADLPVPPGTYTVVAAGEVSADIDSERAFTPVILLDEAREPAENESLVRVAHLAPDAPAIDVTTAEGNETLFGNLSYPNASDYETVPAGNYTLELRPANAGEDEDPVATVNVTLNGSTAYTAFAVGYLDPEEAPGNESFRVQLEEDQVREPVPGAAGNATGEAGSDEAEPDAADGADAGEPGDATGQDEAATDEDVGEMTPQDGEGAEAAG